MICLIVLIPVVIACLAKFRLKWDISWREFGIQIVAGVAAVSLIWVIGNFTNTSDREVLSSYVTSKSVEREHCYTNMIASVCENSYGCNYRQVCTSSTDSKGNTTQSCHMENDTCYVYDWEQDWNVESPLGSFEIDRVDDQGAKEPARYRQVQKGDPVSTTHSYQNWVKASSGTLFRDSESVAEQYKSIIPAYPMNIYDYYNIDRVVTIGVSLSNKKIWNKAISHAETVLGPHRQMNLIIVFVENKPREFAQAVRYTWGGFKKNDAVVFVGTNNGVVAWTEVMSWSKNPGFDVRTRQLMDVYVGQPVTSIAPTKTVTDIKNIALANFERRPMKEFEYLRGDITPPSWLMWLSIIFAIIMGTGLSVLFHKKVCFE